MDGNWNEVSGDPYSPITNTSGVYCLNFTSTVRKFAHVARPTVAALGALASIIGIILIIIVMIKVKEYRTFYYRLLLYLMISTFCVGITQAFSVLPLNEDYKDIQVKEGGWNVACAVIGFLIEVSAWLEHVAIAWITVYIIITVHPRIYNKKVAKNVCEVLGFSIWVLAPLLLCWIPFITGSYGLSGLWCWIKSTNEDCRYASGLWYQLFLFYFPFSILVVFNIIAFLIILCYFCKNYHKDKHVYRKPLKLVISYCFYPIVYDILFAFQLINRIFFTVDFIHKHTPNYSLWIAHSLVDAGRSFYPPFIFLIVSAVSYFHGKCRDTKHNVPFEDLHASHRKSSEHAIPSETHVHFPSEFSSEEQDQLVDHARGSGTGDSHVQYGSVHD